MGVTQIGLRKRILFLSSVWRCQIKRESSVEQLLRHFDEENFSIDLLNSKVSNERVPQTSCGDDNSDCTMNSSFLNDTNYEVVEENSKSWKLIISCLYFLFSTCVTSFVMVLAHERLPEISKYPPLPDLFLDNLPHISWGFTAAEWVGVILSAIWITILIFHKYRWILVRRFFVLMGTVFLLRSITMIITSLSVPGRHLAEHCSPYMVKNQNERLKRVLDIWLGMGMSISGIQTCGDYMFSGHTTCLTLLNFFITEYSPRNFQLLHTFSWVLNLFGVFFILACHEHYSIDVFIAIYVSSRLFLYYHCLANSNILHQPGKERTMIWFPLFSFMEYDVKSTVPNIFEIPFRYKNNLSETNNDDGNNYLCDKTISNTDNKQLFHCTFHKDFNSSLALDNPKRLKFRNNSKGKHKRKENC
ncbi:unnamed protein product [Heterobilharzia americana]|nr:unnamed protein product [Heterobilharzia americana]